jgi:hypothetical protein
MGLNTKNKAGINGFTRIPDYSGAGGVWNLKMHQIEMSYKSWPDTVLWEADNNNPLSGWSTNGISVNNSIGYPTAPSIQVTGNGQYGHYEPIANEDLFYKTISFRCYVTNGAINVHFHCATNGQGPFIKLDSRAGSSYTGIMYANSWGNYQKEPLYGPKVALNTWVQVKIRMYASSRCGWFTSGEFRDIFPFQSNGNRIAVSSFNGGTGYIDNLEIYRGHP